MLEFKNGKVWGQSSLFTFFSYNTDTNVSYLNHADIISTISNPKNNFSSVIFDTSCNDSFLRWWNSATDDSWGLCCSCIEEIREVGQRIGKRYTINNQDSIRFY